MIDRERIQQVIRWLRNSTSAELAVREGASFIRVKRDLAPPVVTRLVASAGPRAAQEFITAPGVAADDLLVRARLVGRFYHGKGPGQPPLVKIGDQVAEGDVVATIEALGKNTGVPCSGEGEVIEFMAEDGAPVGYGTPLIRLRRLRG